jgi:hypothetical protein
MKCHLCKSELKLISTGSGGDYQQAYCANHKCQPANIRHRCEYVTHKASTLTTEYIMLFPREDANWYRLIADDGLTSYKPEMTKLFKIIDPFANCSREDKLIIAIPRFYPLDISKDMDEQFEDICQKLKLFLVFS